ncbi:cytochrome C oxidase subunit III [Corallococcus coralloides]|uniref:cytochrome C oxidase subunit III n=1 Tax=Corallococcus coralloides TaxID=184914 RepID=UPI00384F43D5
MSTNERASPSPHHDEGNLWFGAVIAHGAAAMLFCAMAFTAGFYRLRGFWPPASARPGVLVPALAGGLLVIGAVLLHVALRRPRPARLPLAGVLGAGAGFLATQAAWLHVLFWYRDLRIPDSGVFASALYGLSAVHAAHLAVVLLGLLRAGLRVLRGQDASAPVRRALPGWWCSTMMYGVLFAVVYLP